MKLLLKRIFLGKDGADLMARKEQITQACEMNNARAYLCPHAKNLAHIGIRAKEIYEEGQREGDEEKMRYAHFIACLQEKDVAQMRLLIRVWISVLGFAIFRKTRPTKEREIYQLPYYPDRLVRKILKPSVYEKIKIRLSSRCP